LRAAGIPVAEGWKEKYGGLEVSEAKRLRAAVLESEEEKSMNSALLMLRLVMGLGIAAHGAQKLFGWFGGGGINGTGTFFDGIGFTPGSRFAVVAGLGEFLGGLLLAIGFLGPIGPALILSVMLAAIFSVHKGHGFFAVTNGAELPILYIVGALTVAWAGAGQYSLDHLVGLDSALLPSVTRVVLAFGVLGALGSLALRWCASQ
jgi:putative oxidoreductase